MRTQLAAFLVIGVLLAVTIVQVAVDMLRDFMDEAQAVADSRGGRG